MREKRHISGLCVSLTTPSLVNTSPKKGLLFFWFDVVRFTHKLCDMSFQSSSIHQLRETPVSSDTQSIKSLDLGSALPPSLSQSCLVSQFSIFFFVVFFLFFHSRRWESYMGFEQDAVLFDREKWAVEEFLRPGSVQYPVITLILLFPPLFLHCFIMVSW